MHFSLIICDDTSEFEKVEIRGGGEKSAATHPNLFISLVCEKCLTLLFFHSFLLILVLAPQFYPRCIASKERKTERESESWLKRHVWWVSIKIQTQNKMSTKVGSLLKEGVL